MPMLPMPLMLPMDEPGVDRMGKARVMLICKSMMTKFSSGINICSATCDSGGPDDGATCIRDAMPPWHMHMVVRCDMCRVVAC